ncbi:hypothetical protein B0I31_10528 [Saccharothrix carnea]|uniref:Uncharacterized protein n=1 Tax=Saccharothrix carnea TaxID=1280637 RepID=A0A2P8I9D1_SACCR|nr:hypothetical protein [Saccharothrix carnea]PSL55071.1 hypothetical protein B0I31_10528 [Saccharothrix carnea]
MTFFLPAPRILSYHDFRVMTDLLRGFLMRLLARPLSGPRHRAITARQIRWHRWKTGLYYYLASGLLGDFTGYPRPTALPRREARSAREWSALHPPPRMAQSKALVRPADRERADRPTREIAYALPNAVAHGIAAEPEVWTDAWPVASHEPWAEEWVEPWAEPADSFTGHLEELPATPLAAACSGGGRHALREPALARYVDDRPGVGEAVFAHSTTDAPSGGARHAAVTADDEDTAQLWEFEPGDLTRWWDEAAERLDAAARDEGRDRPW